MRKTIELAREAFACKYCELPVDQWRLERFAELVRADERIMEVARKHWKLPGTDVIDFVRELLG